jgi:hypothetical protein
MAIVPAPQASMPMPQTAALTGECYAQRKTATGVAAQFRSWPTATGALQTNAFQTDNSNWHV